MTWVRLDDGLLEHPKWIRAIRLGGSPALHLWMALCSWSARHLADGLVPPDLVDAVGGPRGSKVRSKAFRALADAELITVETDGGVSIVDYLEYNPSRAKVLEDRGRRAQSQRDYVDRKKLSVQRKRLTAGHSEHARGVSDAVPSRPAPPPDHPPEEDILPSPDGGASARSTAADVTRVFEYWTQKSGHSGAKLDPTRFRLIRARLQHYDVEDLCKAIDGCVLSDFHMGRHEKTRGQKHDEIALICRDAAHVERFMDIASGKVSGAADHARGGPNQPNAGMTGLEIFARQEKAGMAK